MESKKSPPIVRNGIFSQVKAGNFNLSKETKITLTPIEVGEYSIYVKESLDNTLLVEVNDIVSKEVINTPEGSIIYFDEKVPENVSKYSRLPAVAVSPIRISMKDIEEFTKYIFESKDDSNRRRRIHRNHRKGA